MEESVPDLERVREGVWAGTLSNSAEMRSFTSSFKA